MLGKKQNKKLGKKMFNQDEEQIGNREKCFWQGKSRDCFGFISDGGIRGNYLSLALGTAKFKQLD